MQLEQAALHAEVVVRAEARKPSLLLRSAAASSASAAAVERTPIAASSGQPDSLPSIDELLVAGRKKFSRILSVATRFLLSLQPKQVNKNGGSHVVYHFTNGTPVTLVRLHGKGKGDSVSPLYCTRLYAALHELALSQL